MSRRVDVYRGGFAGQAQARPRSIGVEILCDINPSPDLIETTDPSVLCSIDFESVGDYQRFFMSASANNFDPGGNLGAFWIEVVGQQLVPQMTTSETGPISVTGAIDLPEGAYTAYLYMQSYSFDSPHVDCAAASLQIISGQLVDEQVCWIEPGE